MKKFLFILVFVTLCGYAKAQYATYTPITREPVNYNYQQSAPTYHQSTPSYQPQQTYQPQVSYTRVRGVAKDGRFTELKIKYIDGQISSVEYFNTTLKMWANCAAVSKTNKYSLDDYEKVYDYKVQPQVGESIYYF